MPGASGIAAGRSRGPGSPRAPAGAIAALALFALVDLVHSLPVLRAGPDAYVASLRDAEGYTG